MISSIPPQRLVNLFIEANIPPNNFQTTWELFGDWQIDILKKYGLKKGNTFLDVGCGPLRLGMRVIPFLDGGNYCGMEPYFPYIELGKSLAREIGINSKFQVICSGNFDFDKFGLKFDMGMAQSVFTHLSREQIEACVKSLCEVMKPTGKFIFTYIAGDKSYGFLYEGRFPVMVFGQCDKKFLGKIAEKYKLKFREIDASHPTGQRVGIFDF